MNVPYKSTKCIGEYAIYVDPKTSGLTFMPDDLTWYLHGTLSNADSLYFPTRLYVEYQAFWVSGLFFRISFKAKEMMKNTISSMVLLYLRICFKINWHYLLRKFVDIGRLILWANLDQIGIGMLGKREVTSETQVLQGLSMFFWNFFKKMLGNDETKHTHTYFTYMVTGLIRSGEGLISEKWEGGAAMA